VSREDETTAVTPRPLSEAERKLLVSVLESADFSGRDELLAQMNGVEVVGRCNCGCATVTLRVDSRPPADETARPIPNEAWVLDAEGESVGGVLVFTRGGDLCELELYSNSDEPIREIPSIERVRLSQVPLAPVPSPEADRQLLRLWQLWDGELTDQVYEETERLLPAVAAAGYVRITGDTWAYTTAGVERAEQLERDG
jgi:hypothetical protein